MADKISADAPAAPQHRKQIMDEAGSFHPVPDVPQKPEPTTEPAPRPFKIGDAVTLAGHVLEVQHPQGGQVSVKVQLANGAEWIRGEYLTHSK